MERWKIGPAGLVAVVPRQMGYVPEGLVSIGLVSERGVVECIVVLRDVSTAFSVRREVGMVAEAVRSRGVVAAYVTVIGWNTPTQDTEGAVETAAAAIRRDMPHATVQRMIVEGDQVRHEDGTREPIPDLPDSLTGALGARPEGDHEVMASRWASSGALVPRDHELDPVQCWAAILDGHADDAQVEQAAHALEDVAVRDAILHSLTTREVSNTEPTPVIPDLWEAARFSLDKGEAVRRVAVRMSDETASIPMLTVLTTVLWAMHPHYRVGVQALSERLVQIGHGHYRLAVLVLTMIARDVPLPTD